MIVKVLHTILSIPIPCPLTRPLLDFYFAGQLEDYRVMNKLGQGQFGIVKLGVHVVTGDRVALKIINKADLSDVERCGLSSPPFPPNSRSIFFAVNL